ncbi:N-acyl homoserine lactonase family protein [Kribbella capetownensis]|uniref:N-acyl homoserine lactonase family protein n=1 Tax=Kribbella capetownensis TaxID=1572659 RepID=A0A4R0JYA0_9ACTN|nr:N-acyl homoserine lactonase family protein [Kribbella capetownensis]TCC52551.1 N-acyl homoserine lactonase family protein [Kribbella capetownensis]
MPTIDRVSVVSTGTVKIRPEHVGPTTKNLYVWLATSREWTQPRPVNAYVVQHADGLVLFDTGQDRASVTDPGYFPGGLNGVVYDRLAQFEIGPEQTLTRQLAAIGYDIRDVHTAVLSHLHQDHIGGLPELAHARIVISEPEWTSMRRPLAAARGFLRSHIELPGLRWDLIRPEPLDDSTIAPFSAGHDLFGDGSLVLLPTPGHTPGSLSLLVRRPEGPPLLMVGDLTYDANLLAAGEIPGVGSRSALRRTVAQVNELRALHPDLVVLAAHDPAAAGLLARAVPAGAA